MRINFSIEKIYRKVFDLQCNLEFISAMCKTFVYAFLSG